jgi:hypothetical protein
MAPPSAAIVVVGNRCPEPVRFEQMADVVVTLLQPYLQLDN